MEIFLYLNSFELNASQQEQEQLILSIAAGKLIEANLQNG